MVSTSKQEMRQKGKRNRALFPIAYWQAADTAIVGHLQADVQIKQVCVLACYLPLPHEVLIDEFISWCGTAGKLVCVPAFLPGAKAYGFVEFTGWDDVVTVSGKGRQPKMLMPIAVDRIDVALIPGVAFDAQGYRIGYGGGVYDRLLAQLPQSTVTIGVLYAKQLVRRVENEAHDIAVIQLVTENGIIVCQK